MRILGRSRLLPFQRLAVCYVENADIPVHEKSAYVGIHLIWRVIWEESQLGRYSAS